MQNVIRINLCDATYAADNRLLKPRLVAKTLKK